jgi:hypothetical protein
VWCASEATCALCERWQQANTPARSDSITVDADEVASEQPAAVKIPRFPCGSLLASSLSLSLSLFAQLSPPLAVCSQCVLVTLE